MASWPDVALALILLARENLTLFVIVSLGLAIAGGVALAIMALTLKVVVLGPLTRFRIDYQAARRRGAERPKQEKLPLC
jgi:hypothetical protein